MAEPIRYIFTFASWKRKLGKKAVKARNIVVSMRWNLLPFQWSYTELFQLDWKAVVTIDRGVTGNSQEGISSVLPWWGFSSSGNQKAPIKSAQNVSRVLQIVKKLIKKLLWWVQIEFQETFTKHAFRFLHHLLSSLLKACNKVLI